VCFSECTRRDPRPSLEGTNEVLFRAISDPDTNISDGQPGLAKKFFRPVLSGILQYFAERLFFSREAPLDRSRRYTGSSGNLIQFIDPLAH